MFLLRMICIFFCVVIKITHICSSSTPIVKIADGPIAGTVIRSVNGRPIYAFYDIPYAAPPVLKLRFREPQPVKPWMGIWNASQPTSICHHLHHGSHIAEGSEDCLHLNVFTSKLPSSDHAPKLDVLFFIHGGAFMFGAGNHYGPEYLLDSDEDDIVFVSINYRLGPLGFISTGDDVVPGNNGMKDQVAALRWVQKNIAAFGGNPKSVTLFGNSAGGASVQYHFLSPMSDGLFHRGFSQSGTPLNPWAFCEKNVEKTHLLAATLGCPTHDSKELVECLRERPANRITLFSSHLQGWLYNPFSPWGPSIEINSSKSFLSEDPYKLLERGQIKDLPWLASYTTDEGLYPVAEYAEKAHLLKELDERWNEIAPSFLDFVNTVPPENQARISAEIRRNYFGDNSISMETYKNLIQVAGDRHFMVGIQQSARFQAAANKSPVYLFHFAAPIKKSLATLFSGVNKNYGVSHCDDLGYMLLSDWGEPSSSKEDWALSRLLVKILISFTKNGVPFAGNTSLPAVSRNIKRVGELDYFEIRSHSDLKVLKKQSLNNYEFWTSFGYSTY